MKYYVILGFVIGYLYLTVSGETDETFSSATNIETSRNSTRTYVKESLNNATNLEELSKNATDLDVILQDSVPYVMHNETEPILEHGIKSKIKGGYNKVKNKIKGIGTKIGNKIKEIGTGGGGSIGGGGGTSGNYRYRYRYRKPTGTYSSDLDTSTILYIVFGVIGGVILITIIYYFLRA